MTWLRRWWYALTASDAAPHRRQVLDGFNALPALRQEDAVRMTTRVTPPHVKVRSVQQWKDQYDTPRRRA